MNLYGDHSSSHPQKLVMLGVGVCLLAVSYLVLFGQAASFGAAEAGQRTLILSFSLVTFLRFCLTLGFLLKRTVPWEEALTVPVAFGLYYLGFAYLTTWTSVPTFMMTLLGVLLFAGGASLNTLSELQRHVWKQRPENRGKLYTGGLFRYAVHINYFGDILWVLGYAVITATFWAYLIPALLFGFFSFYNVPKLDAYLSKKYAPEFQNYQRRTKHLVPYLY